MTARPRGGRDVGYRTIARPLIEMLRQTQLPVQVDIVRPGSYRPLVEHLQTVRTRHGVGYYHLIHFDLHGAVVNRDRLEQLGSVSPHIYKVRPTAWLFFEDERGDDLDAASAQEIAALLLDYQIPLAVLNACQSGQETGDSETSLGSQLLQAGVQTVLAMGYSVTVSAATLLMEHFYRTLFDQRDLAPAIAAGRTALYNQKRRRAYFNQQIPLEDWLLPVVYQRSPSTSSSTTATARPALTISWAAWRRSSGSGRRPSSTTSRRSNSKSSTTTATARPAPITSWAGWRKNKSSGSKHMNVS